MNKRRIAGFLMFLVLVLCAKFAIGDPGYVFRPTTYTRDRPKPYTVTNNFNVSSKQGEYTLTVRSGNQEGEKRVTSAIITLNGVVVVGPDEFNKQIDIITKSVTDAIQQGSNTITVEVRGDPLTFITVSITGEGGKPPVLG